MMSASATVRDGAELAVHELTRAIPDTDWAPWEALPDLITGSARVFVVGNGRSGLAMRMGAMRLMHVGCTVHVVGEVTTPAIRQGDLLLAVSGSGTTHGTLHAAQTAAKLGATVAAVTADADSPLAQVATHVLVVPGAVKTDRSGSLSGQYAGTAFEQLTLLLLDAVFYALWQRGSQSADELYARHGNLE
jgi:6-phospho-3-hexuloisomerase